jgi:hypothetical protein
MRDAWAEMGKFSLGLPCTVRTLTGDILIIYYSVTPHRPNGIEWVRVRC